jgi:hypothetical protein
METPLELRQITVRGAGGKTAKVRVVQETEDTYYVVGEAEYQRARQDGTVPEPRIGFPKSDAVEA